MKRLLLTLCFLMAVTCLCADLKVLAFAGSTRDGSYNKKLVAEAAFLAKQLGAKVTLVDLKDYPMPFYNADEERLQGMPCYAKRFRALMVESNAIIIASPDYNSSVSALLKNALDWASRGENGGASRDAFKGKKFAIMSASPGAGGGAGGLNHLEAIITDIGGQVVPIKVSVGRAQNAFDNQGHLVDPALRQKLKQEVQQLF